jgi:pSer/pThr/pTyr-binding forkhead associated (FHA) protein
MPASFRIVLKSGPTPGKAFPLEKPEMFIGRDLANEIVINDPEVSRRHARLYLQNNYYVLEDMGSTNGTSVNGQRLTGPYLLRPGEQITFGERVNLVFESAVPPATQATESVQQATYPTPQAPSAQPTYYPTPPAAPYNPPPAQAQPPAYNPPQPTYAPPPAQQAPAYAPPPVQPPAYNPPAQQGYDAGAYPAQVVYPGSPQPYENAAPAPFAGQVPMAPYNEPPQVVYRIPIWMFVVIGVLLLTILILLIDDFRLWCPLFGLC